MSKDIQARSITEQEAKKHLIELFKFCVNNNTSTLNVAGEIEMAQKEKSKNVYLECSFNAKVFTDETKKEQVL